MRLGAVLHSVVTYQEVHEPGMSFLLILWLVKVVEGLVHLLYRAKWPLDLTFRAGCHASAILSLWQVSTHINVQVAHDLLKDVAPGDRTVIQVDHFRNPLKQESVDLLRRHRVKQETQSGFNILTVNTTVFLISHAAAVIDDAEEHQCGRTLVRLQPQGVP